MLRLKKALKLIGISLCILAVSLTATVYLLSDKIQKVLLKEINEQLAVEGSFKKLEVTFWKTFPKVGLRMENLTLKESTPLLNKYMMEADVFYLQFNLMEAVFGKYELEKVSADDLVIRLAVKGAKENYMLFKNDNTDSINDKRIKIDLKAISLRNALIEYHDLKDTTTIIYDFEKIKSKGEIETDKVDFKFEAKGKGKTFVISNDTLPIDKTTSLDARITYQIEEEQLSIKNGTLNIDNSGFGVEGLFVFADKDSMDLRFESQGSKISKIAELLPKEIGSSLGSLKSEGEFSIQARIAGSFNGDNIPTTDAKIIIKDGKLFPKIGQKPMEKINLNANVLFGKNKEYIQIPVFNFKMGEHTFSGNFDLNGWDDPYIDGRFLGKIDLGYLHDLFDLEDVELSGLLNCDFNIKGKISELSSGKQFQESGLWGAMQWNKVSFISKQELLKDWILTECDADWKMNGNRISANNVTGKINDGNFKMNIALDHFLPYLFDNVKSEIFADIVADKIVLPLSLTGQEEPNGDEEDTTDLFAMFPENIVFDLTFNIDEFESQKLSISKFKGSMFANEKQIRFSNASGECVEGLFETSILLKKREDNTLFSNIDLNGKGFNIYKLFKTFENFGQDEITQNNLEGKLDINTQMVIILGRDGSFSKENLYAFSELSIINGVLKNYEPMKSLSDYAEISELENIKFGTLTNTIEIKDGEINFPFMDMSNSILNIKIKGNHKFDNYMDYTFRVRLSDALAAKYNFRSKRNKDEFEDLGNKGVAIYVRMTGYPDNLKFKVEKVGMKPIITKESVNQEINSAREEFKQTIKQEFSIENREEKKRQEAQNEKVDWDE
ncbi:MAG: hypothetical protein J5I91_01535 [Bacteroidetes bacterium]|nr:hypothetical protein [Bacteroidota bacterium]